MSPFNLVPAQTSRRPAIVLSKRTIFATDGNIASVMYAMLQLIRIGTEFREKAEENVRWV